MRKALGYVLFYVVMVGVVVGLALMARSETNGGVTTTTVTTSFVCHPRMPAAAGECAKQQLRAEHKAVGEPRVLARLGAPPRCVDVSRWNGVPNFRSAGARCVIIQTNEGQVRNVLFDQQVAAARRAGIPWGTYTYLDGESGAAQEHVAAGMAAGKGRTLGVWADAEITEAYPQVCSYLDEAARHAATVGAYDAVGLWPGIRCVGFSWPAEWGTALAVPLPGYPRSSVLLRQNCGTCRLAGFSGEVDVDEALGVLKRARALGLLVLLDRDRHRQRCSHRSSRRCRQLAMQIRSADREAVDG